LFKTKGKKAHAQEGVWQILESKADPPADDKGKEAKKPDPKRRPPPKWAPRGVPGGYFVTQSPCRDKDGNKIEVKYTDVYWHQGM